MKSSGYSNVRMELAALDAKVNALLPPRYQHCYTSVPPESMGSAGIRYKRDGKVAWDEIWTTFCDLALAGGPPHRGRLLEPVSEEEVTAAPEGYREVTAEIDRGVGMTTGLRTTDGYAPGWLGIRCRSLEEAAWLQFAVTAENVSARRRGAVLQLPAGPAFRVEKEIKNVVVALAKSCHYWDGHLTGSQQTLAGEDVWEATTPTEAAADPAGYRAAMDEMESSLRAASLTTAPRMYTGWVGVETMNDEQAVWMLRAVLVERVLIRREGRLLYIPMNAAASAGRAEWLGRAIGRAKELWAASSPRRRSW